MEYRRLGSTGLDVSVLGFGMWPIGGTQRAGDYGTVSDDDAVAAIGRALDLGVTLFDTAPAYGNGRAEEILRLGLGGRRDEAIITTKCAVHWDYDAERWITTSTHDAIVESADDSLRRLGTDRIDLLLIHVPDPDGSPEGAMQAFQELVDVGKVRAVGVSNFTIDQIDEYRAFGHLQVQQLGYNMLDRRIEATMIPRCQELGLGLMTYGSLCHGLFSGAWSADHRFPSEDWRAAGDVFGLPLFAGDNLRKNIEVADRLGEFAATQDHTVAQLAIAWVVQNQAVGTTLAGMRAPTEVDENVVAVDWKLDPDDLASIQVILADAAGTVGPDHYVVNAAADSEP